MLGVQPLDVEQRQGPVEPNRVVSNPCHTSNVVLLWPRENHYPFRPISVRVPLLPLEESVLPVVLLESGKTLDGANTKVDNNGIHILHGEVTEPAKHLCHDRGLRL